MAPHIFHAISDDPARQFGCMAALFHLFHHHPRFSSPRSRTTSPDASSRAAAAHNSKTSTRSANSAKAHRTSRSKDGNEDSTASKYSNSAADVKRRAARKMPNSSSNKRSASHLDSPAIKSQTALSAHEKAVSSTSNESPSILNSSRETNYTIRESPQKYPYNGRAISSAADDDHERCMTKSASSTSSITDSRSSLPSSPHVQPLAQALKEARRSPRSGRVCKSLFVDKPRGAADYIIAADAKPNDMDVPALASSQQMGVIQPRRSRITEDNLKISDGLICKHPPAAAHDLLGLHESVKALKQFIDGFEAQLQQNVKPAKRSSVSWWSNARAKSRVFKNADHQFTRPQTDIDAHMNGFMEAAAAARTSSFDYNEAVRISQKIEETPARLSLDGRELVPKAVMKLREAMRLGSHAAVSKASEALIKLPASLTPAAADHQSTACANSLSWNVKEECAFDNKGRDASECVVNNASRGQRSGNVIARLMGLDSLPASTARDGGADHSSKAGARLTKAPPILFKDLLKYRYPQRSSSKLDQTDSSYSRSACITTAAEQIRGHTNAAAAPTLSKSMEASLISSQDLQSSALMRPFAVEAGSTLINDPDEDCDLNCKTISEVQINGRGANSIALKEFSNSYNTAQLKMRHCAEKGNIQRTASYRQSSRSRGRAAVDGHSLKEAAASDLKEEGELMRHSAAYSRSHAVPCRIVVMEPRFSTRKNSGAGHQYRTEKVTSKCSSNGAHNITAAALDSHKYIKPDAAIISANLQAFDMKADTASSNFCVNDSKHARSAHDINKGRVAAAAILNGVAGIKAVKGSVPSLKPSPPCSSARSAQRAGRLGEQQCAAAHARVTTTALATPARPSYGDRSDIMEQVAQDPPWSEVPSSKSGSRPVVATAASKRAHDLQMAGMSSGQKKMRDAAAAAAEPKERRIAGRGERRGRGQKAGEDVLEEDTLEERAGTMETVINQRRYCCAEGLTNGDGGAKPSAVEAMETITVSEGDEEHGTEERLAAMDSSESATSRVHLVVDAPSTADDDHHSPYLAAGGVLSSAPADVLSTSHTKMMSSKDVTELVARSNLTSNAGRRPSHINEADIQGWINNQFEYVKRISKCSVDSRPPPIVLFSSPTIISYNRDLLYCTRLLQHYSIEQELNEEVANYWTCHTFPPPSSIFRPIFFSLEDAIFQDLLLELF